MAYEKQTWDTNSYVNPTRMNHIENGIQANSNNIDTLTQGASDMSTEISDIKQNIADLQKPYVDVLGGIADLTIDQFYPIDLSQYTELIIKISLSGTVKYAPLYWHKGMGYNDAYCISNYYSSAYCGSIEFQVRENGLLIPSNWTAVKYNNNTVTTFKVSVIGR